MSLSAYQTNEELFYRSLSDLVEISSRVASIRLVRSRDSVLFSRRYLADLSSIFDQVRLSYEHQVSRLGRFRSMQGKKTVTFLSHNGRRVAVLLSANARLYGDLVRQTFEQFVAEIDRGSEVVIVGRVGRQLFRQRYPGRIFSYFPFPDSGWDADRFATLLSHLVNYEAVAVYHGRFNSVLSQEVVRFVLSSHLVLNETETKIPRIEYYFEPSLEGVLPFFEQGIFRALLSQTIREAQLAKYGARLTSLTQARERVRREIGLAHQRRLYFAHQAANKKQLNQLVTFAVGGSL